MEKDSVTEESTHKECKKWWSVRWGDQSRLKGDDTWWSAAENPKEWWREMSSDLGMVDIYP